MLKNCFENTPHRNAPCPCGSGKKYKHCCGNPSVTLAIPALEDEFLYYRDAIASAKKSSTLKQIVSKAPYLEEKAQDTSYLTGVCQLTSTAYRLLYQHTGKNSYLDLADIWCKKSLKAKPKNQIALGDAVIIKTMQKKFAEAKSVFETIEVVNAAKDFAIFSLSIIQNILQTTSFTEEDMQDVNALIESIIKSQAFKDPQIASGAHMVRAEVFYYGRGDVVSAYAELMQSFRATPKEQHPPEIFLLLTYICIDPRINKQKEALEYINLALRNDPKKTEYLLAKANVYIEMKEYVYAKEILSKLAQQFPGDVVYYTYARAFYLNGEPKEALPWIKKALSITLDELNSSYYAFICDEAGLCDEAISAYELAITTHKNKQARELIADASFGKHMSICVGDESEINAPVLSNVYIRFINLLCRNNRINKAREVLDDARKTLPDKNEWLLAETSIAQTELAELEKRRLETLQENIRKNFATAYIGLCEDALKTLTTAETWYQEQKRISKDYSSIIICYCRAFEIQLRLRLSDYLPREKMTLGEIVQEIKKRRIDPYYERTADLEKIVDIRNGSAHRGDATLEDMFCVRKLLFGEKLLNLVSLQS